MCGVLLHKRKLDLSIKRASRLLSSLPGSHYITMWLWWQSHDLAKKNKKIKSSSGLKYTSAKNKKLLNMLKCVVLISILIRPRFKVKKQFIIKNT